VRGNRIREAERDGLVRPKVRRAAAVVFVLLVVYLLASATVLVHSLEHDVSRALEAQLSSERARAADAHKFQTQLGDLQNQLSQAQADLSAARSEVESLRGQLDRLGIKPDPLPDPVAEEAKARTPKGSQPVPSQESASGPAAGGDASDSPSVSPQPQPEPSSPPQPAQEPVLCLLLIQVCL